MPTWRADRSAPSNPARAIALIAAVLTVLASAACSSRAPHTTTTTAPGPPGSPGTEGGAFTGPPPKPAAWTTYGGDFHRSGNDTTSPLAGNPSPLWSTPIHAAVHAQPLVVGAEVVVADESNTVTAVDLTSGKLDWQVTLGSPVPGSDLPCGDIDPSGITGTPVADPVSGKLWVVVLVSGSPSTAMPTPSTTAGASGSTPGTGGSTGAASRGALRHYLFTISLGTGTILTYRPVDPPGADPTTQQQRGALTVANGYVYVPYGGLYGDCGSYRGYVVGVPESGQATATGSGSAPDLLYATDSGTGAGIWDPAGVTVVGSGDLLVATGNSVSTSGYDDGNSVLLLSPQLAKVDSFTPRDAPRLNAADLDLGSTQPVAVGSGHAFVAGKSGAGYVLDLGHLGGVGGQLSQVPVCGGGEALGGSAVSGSYVYLSCSNGLDAVKITGTTASVAWTADTSLVGPPVVSGGRVWYVDIASKTLDAADAATGDVTVTLPIGTAVHFTSPAAADGRIYVVAGGHLQAFGE